MKKVILSACLLAFLSVLFAQNRNEVLFSVGNDKVTVSEFIGTFTKNNSLSNATESELRDYLNLFINFKLKVRDGLDTQIDTLLPFKKELASYKSQSAQSYLVDKEVTDKLMQEAIERSKEMVRASHILLMCEPDVSPKDSLAVFNKIMDIRKRIMAKEFTFPEAAVLYSEDPSAHDEVGLRGMKQFGNKGDLGYFHAFDLIYPFESAAYITPVGTISMPVRSRFGYHIIWVQDKQPAISKIDIGQILLIDSAAQFGRISPAVMEKLALIENAIKEGEDFEELAAQYTEDPSSKKNNGKVDPFMPNRRPGDFVKVCLSLEKNQISEPFSSIVGWHIVKLHNLEVPELKPEDQKYALSTKIQRDTRSNLSVESFLEKLKKEYRFSEKGKDAMFKLLLKNLSDKKTLPTETELLALPGVSKLKPVAIFANQTITPQDFIKYLGRFFDVNLKQSVITFLEMHYQNFIKENIITYEFENLENKYPEFQELMNEYKYGMILFEMNNEKVWSEALKDTLGLENFYEEMKFNYLDITENPKPLSEVRSIVLTDFQNKLEDAWLSLLRERYQVWINEELFNSLLKNK
ncbi:MAG: peptidylprolyl isomerase [Bacteroidales bacterium]|jgi:peptidyl-prolyl cis-trans isomerase SurA|nr:peptidylprolyl isomerase [Bacteroidales bacterium]